MLRWADEAQAHLSAMMTALTPIDVLYLSPSLSLCLSHCVHRKLQSGDGLGLNMAIDEDNIYSGVELELPPYMNYDPSHPTFIPPKGQSLVPSLTSLCLVELKPA